MSLNIKNKRTVAHIDRLAHRLGSTKTSAVEEAVVRWLRELDAQGDTDAAQERRLAKQAAINRFREEIRINVVHEPGLRERLDAEIYDEAGLLR